MFGGFVEFGEVDCVVVIDKCDVFWMVLCGGV